MVKTGAGNQPSAGIDYRAYLAEQFQQIVAPPPQKEKLPSIEHAGMLEDLEEMPAYLMSCHEHGHPKSGRYSCSFCGVGDSGTVLSKTKKNPAGPPSFPPGECTVTVQIHNRATQLYAMVHSNGLIEIQTQQVLTLSGGVLNAALVQQGKEETLTAREVSRQHNDEGMLTSQTFSRYTPSLKVTQSTIKFTMPTTGCAKLKLSFLQKKPAFPIQIAPSVLDRQTGGRRSLPYEESISRLADLLLAHRIPNGRTLIYASGQLDYFTIFAMQEVFRLLGIRNLTGNAEHCLNAGAVHNQVLTGQEGPFLTIEQSINGPNRFFLFNGWNGYITHPPVFHQLSKRKDLDGYMIEVMVSESAKILASKIGSDRILLIKSSSDPHLALAIANQIFKHHPDAIEPRFIEQFSSTESFEQFKQFASDDYFLPHWTAQRIAPEPKYEERLVKGIIDIAARLADPKTVPINMPSVGLSQTSGIVTHCLWGNVMAMVGKYGLNADGSPAGGTLRVPGQINAESEVQGLSRNYFMGRLPVDKHAEEVARRMDLPDDAYAKLKEDTPRAALDYSDPRPGERELFLCFGTHFESNMMNRTRWVEKLQSSETTLVVVDPIVDPFSLENAELVIPSPIHPATTKLYQNGEWKLSLSIPQKKAPPETRSDATIIYDVMAEISRRVRTDPTVAAAHPDLARHSDYMRRRFEPPEESETGPITGPFTKEYVSDGLIRVDGEVSRSQLWDRIIHYMNDGPGRSGPLYCRFEHSDGRSISWDEMLRKGSVVYGGVGTTRYRLDYDDPDHHPFGDLFQRPNQFKFFVPTHVDLEIPEGIILNSGRSTLSDDTKDIRWAISTFNSGKGTPITNMPDQNMLHISLPLAERFRLQEGDKVRVTNTETSHSIILPVRPTNRVKGEACYISFHKCKAEIEEGRYINTITSHTKRCPYSSQTKVKATQVTIEPLQMVQNIDPKATVAMLSPFLSDDSLFQAISKDKP